MPKVSEKTLTRHEGLKPLASTQQRKLAHEILEAASRGENVTRTELVRRAGYAPSMADRAVGRIWDSEGLQNALAELGVTPQKMVKVLDDGMQAKVVTVFHGEAFETQAPDHSIRLKAIDQLADVMGLKKMTVEQRNINVNLDGDDLLSAIGL